MPGRRRELPALITSAKVPASLDTHQRSVRYFLTMSFRVLCFLAGVFAPTPFNLMLIVAAAVLPAFAVLLANAVDNKTPPMAAESPGPLTAPALSSALIVPGHVEREEPAR